VRAYTVALRCGVPPLNGAEDTEEPESRARTIDGLSGIFAVFRHAVIDLFLRLHAKDYSLALSMSTIYVHSPCEEVGAGNLLKT
jgi:hypothetical protein